MDGILSVTPSSLFTCCIAGFWSSGVGAGLSETVIAFTSPPLPGGCGTDFRRLLGYRRYPGMTSPSGLPARSAFGRFAIGVDVGNLTLLATLPLLAVPLVALPAGAAGVR